MHDYLEVLDPKVWTESSSTLIIIYIESRHSGDIFIIIYVNKHMNNKTNNDLMVCNGPNENKRNLRK